VTVADALSGPAGVTLLVRRAAVDTKTAAPFTLTWHVPADALIGLQETPRSSPRIAPATPPACSAPSRSIRRPDAADRRRACAGDRRARCDRPGRRRHGRRSRREPRRADAQRRRDDDARAGDGDGAVLVQAIATIPSTLADGAIVTFADVGGGRRRQRGGGSASVKVVTSVPTTRLQVTVDPPVSPTFQTSGVITGTIGRGTSNAPPAAPPIVADVTPQSGRQGQTLDLVITGINTAFTNLSQVTFGPGLTVSGITPTDGRISPRTCRSPRAPPSVRARRGVDRHPGGPARLGVHVVSGTGVISGRLLSAQGQPIANATGLSPGHDDVRDHRRRRAIQRQ